VTGKAPKPPFSAKVAVGQPVIGTSAGSLASILVPIRYPIELTGRIAETRVALIGRRGKPLRSWVLHERLSNGGGELPERRRRFTFVHRIGLNAALSRQLRRGAKVRVVASGRLDIEEDGKAEMRSRDVRVDRPLTESRGFPICSTIPHLRVRRGQRISVPLPVCDREMDWDVRQQGSRGFARVRGDRLIYKAPQRFRGSDWIELLGSHLRQETPVTVGAASNLVVRALGDSVTAGFGYYATGSEMSFTSFAEECRPVEKNLNDACSSNSLATKAKETTKVEYSPDFGRAKNVSWAAQWANEYGVTDYRNYAISGSEPGAWAPGGESYETTEKIEKEKPDYILLTLGANPLLSHMLTEWKNFECAIGTGLPEFEECVEKEFTKVQLRQNLAKVYKDLVTKTTAKIYVMQYHLSVPAAAPYTAAQIARMGQMVNEEVAAVAASFSSSRLQTVEPPHFNVGVDLSPVYLPTRRCRLRGYLVDGPSVQSSWTQDEYEAKRLIDPFFEFCSGPEEFGPNWVIRNDTGIHPTATGYTQMASQVPAPTS
jgi:lysophospholipase L1-like esterase